MLTKNLIICSLIILIVYAIYAGDKKEHLNTSTCGVAPELTGYTALAYGTTVDEIDYSGITCGHCVTPNSNIMLSTANKDEALAYCDANANCIGLKVKDNTDEVANYGDDDYMVVHANNGVCDLARVVNEGKDNLKYFWYDKDAYDPDFLKKPTFDNYTVLNYSDGGYTSGHCTTPSGNIIEGGNITPDNPQDAIDICDAEEDCIGFKYKEGRFQLVNKNIRNEYTDYCTMDMGSNFLPDQGWYWYDKNEPCSKELSGDGKFDESGTGSCTITDNELLNTDTRDEYKELSDLEVDCDANDDCKGIIYYPNDCKGDLINFVCDNTHSDWVDDADISTYYKVDKDSPVLAKVQEITEITNEDGTTKWTYIFSSNEAGTMTFSDSSGNNIIPELRTVNAGENTIEFTDLPEGAIFADGDLKIIVTDSSGNPSEPLEITGFTVSANDPNANDPPVTDPNANDPNANDPNANNTTQSTQSAQSVQSASSNGGTIEQQSEKDRCESDGGTWNSNTNECEEDEEDPPKEDEDFLSRFRVPMIVTGVLGGVMIVGGLGYWQWKKSNSSSSTPTPTPS